MPNALAKHIFYTLGAKRNRLSMGCMGLGMASGTGKLGSYLLPGVHEDWNEENFSSKKG